jgi:hypothetical protein
MKSGVKAAAHRRGPGAFYAMLRSHEAGDFAVPRTAWQSATVA